MQKSRAVQEETAKLVQVGIVRVVKYSRWISNPVMIAKSDNIWRMCIEFKDLNKARTKDSNPLPEIEKKIESLAQYLLESLVTLLSSVKSKEKENSTPDTLDTPYRPSYTSDVSKFTRRIAEVTLPPKLRYPSTVDKYDGTQDPEDHLHAFRGATMVSGWSMLVWCLMFP